MPVQLQQIFTQNPRSIELLIERMASYTNPEQLSQYVRALWKKDSAEVAECREEEGLAEEEGEGEWEGEHRGRVCGWTRAET